MSIDLEKTVKIKQKAINELLVEDEALNEDTFEVLNECDFTGKVTGFDEKYIFVGFIDSNETWVTMMFLEEELEVLD